MIKFEIITIFPELFSSFCSESIIKRAQKKRLIQIKVHNLRDFTKDVHKSVDDKPFGGGAGMVLKIEPIYKAVKKIRQVKESKKQETKIILFSPRGKQFDQKTAVKLSKLKKIVMICGRYEGIDERVAEYIADEQISIGNFVIMGGEVAAMTIMEAVSRLIPGVLGKADSLKATTPNKKKFIEYPQYTRPEIFNADKSEKKWKACPPKFRKTKFWRVPKVLVSGNHKKIKEWREKHSKIV